jgi:peptidoglycan/LPS O-acetylase OafA/YrhL
MTLNKTFSLQRLQRVTTANRVIPEIDGLRFLAIVSVVFFHLRTHLLRTSPFELTITSPQNFIFDLISNGGFGVNIFFGISGFILALPFANHYLKGSHRVDLKAYYVRRLTRLEPPYFIIMTMLFLLSVIYLNSPFRQLLPHFFASLGYSHFFVYGEWSTINPVAWSLETEVQFYILAPLIFMIFRVGINWYRRSLILIAMVAFTILHFIFIETYINLHIYKSLLVYIPFFLSGVLFADYYLEKISSNNIEKNHLWDIIGTLSTILVFRVDPNDGVIPNLVLLAALFLIFVSTFRGKVLNKVYTTSFIFITGGMCYTIYLVHYALIAFIMQFTSKLGFNGSLIINLLLQAIIILPILFVFSSIFFLLFEKPFMYKNWPRKLKYLFVKTQCQETLE